MSVKNPQSSSPPQAGLPEKQKADLPGKLQDLFNGRKFLPLDPPEFVDHEGVELLLIGAGDDVPGELDIDLRPGDEDECTAEIFRDLRLKKSEHPVEPLLQGEWK